MMFCRQNWWFLCILYCFILTDQELLPIEGPLDVISSDPHAKMAMPDLQRYP